MSSALTSLFFEALMKVSSTIAKLLVVYDPRSCVFPREKIEKSKDFSMPQNFSVSHN